MGKGMIFPLFFVVILCEKGGEMTVFATYAALE